LLKQPASLAYAQSPYTLEVKGKAVKAAQQWQAIGARFEEASAWLACADEPGVSKAMELFTQLGAAPAVELAKSMARKLGLRGIKRGPYGTARELPLGLTSRELLVLQLIARGHSNSDIAQKLSRSQRTVEHHVSALLAKLSAKNRSELIELAAKHQLNAPK
jgi:DNA-binding CsgD family transcriptional regulator